MAFERGDHGTGAARSKVVRETQPPRLVRFVPSDAELVASACDSPHVGALASSHSRFAYEN